jgi:heme-degrading monooxygenase HmoA
MFVALWEYEVKRGDEERFEKAYGPGGDWAKLFRSDPHCHETRLMRDAFRRGAYFTMDFWESRSAYEEFMAGHRREYEALDARGEQMTTKERRIGLFEVAED